MQKIRFSKNQGKIVEPEFHFLAGCPSMALSSVYSYLPITTLEVEFRLGFGEFFDSSLQILR